MTEKAFEPTPLELLITFLVQRAGHELGAVELAKLLYLIDLEKIRFLGTTVTGQEYIRAQQGPLARDFADAIRRLSGHELAVRNEPRPSGVKHCHVPGDSPRFEPVLSPEDEAIALRVLTRTRGLSLLQLIRVAYKTEPMQALLGLEREAGKSLSGATIDLALAPRDARFLRWEANRGKKLEPDEAYERFLKEERAEVDELIASLG